MKDNHKTPDIDPQGNRTKLLTHNFSCGCIAK